MEGFRAGHLELRNEAHHAPTLQGVTTGELLDGQVVHLRRAELGLLEVVLRLGFRDSGLGFGFREQGGVKGLGFRV